MDILLAKSKILIIDSQIESSLRSLNADYIIVSTVIDVITKLIEEQIFLIILDLNIIELDGFELATLIRNNQNNNNIPIVFMFDYSESMLKQISNCKLDNIDYIIKPATDFIIRNKINTYIKLHNGNNSNLVNIVKQLSDVKNELENKNKDLEELASLDPLTGLANRRAFNRELERNVASAVRHKEELAVLFFDLDNFKFINDRHGHQIGDKLLQYISTQISQVLRKEDYFARIGGDEFAMILSKHIHVHHVTQTANRVIFALSKVFNVSELELQISTSIGIACFPFAGISGEELMKNADVAMYLAKSLGKNQYQFYSSELSENCQRRGAIEINLKKSLISLNDFNLVYQPIFDLATDQPMGVETLVRWKNDELGIVRPDEFIPISEDTGDITQLGAWIIEQALLQHSLWHKAGINKIKIAINLSPIQLDTNNIHGLVQALLNKYSINVDEVELEVTETALMHNETKEIAILKSLTELGVKINLDDFGTGHSSFVRLINLPLSAIKIDQCFVKDVNNNKNKAEIVKTLLFLAKCLNLKVIAEGIETIEEYKFLQKHQCDYGQGFFMSKPVCNDEIFELFIKGQSKTNL